MKKIISIILSTTLILSIFSFAQFNVYAASNSQTVSVKVKINVNHDYENECLKIVNKERKKKGLKALVMDKNLYNIAHQRAAEIAVMYYTPEGKAHHRPDGKHYSSIKGIHGENSGYTWGEETPERFMKGIMASKGHNYKIIGKEYKGIGIACVYAGGTQYWIQVFTKNKPQKSYSSKGKKRITKSVNILKKYFTDEEIGINVICVDNIKKQYIYTSIGDGVQVAPECVSYTYTNKNNVTLSEKGLLSFKNTGSTKITAKIKNLPKKTATAAAKYNPDFTVSFKKSTFTYNGKQQYPSVSNKVLNEKYNSYGFFYARPKNSKNVGDYIIYSWMENPNAEDPYSFGWEMPYETYAPEEEYHYDNKWEYGDYLPLSCTKRSYNYYQIIPQSTQLKSLTKGKTSVTVKWNKQDVQTTGYQIQYSTDKNFKTASSIKVDKSKTSTTIKNLKKNKRYYFRIRTYKSKKTTVNYYDRYDYTFNYCSLKGDYVKDFCSYWSESKSIKI